MEIKNSNFVWTTVKLLNKITYDFGEIIFRDNAAAESMYFIHKGIVRLYAENNYPFSKYNTNDEFGDNDMMLNLHRMGTAKAMTKCQLYRITRTQLNECLEEFPMIK